MISALEDDILVGNPAENLEQRPLKGHESGRVSNNSNAEIYAFVTTQSGSEATFILMPGQTVDLLSDTVEVRMELVDDSFGDQVISIEVVMPDGTAHSVSSLPATVRLAPVGE